MLPLCLLAFRKPTSNYGAVIFLSLPDRERVRFRKRVPNSDCHMVHRLGCDFPFSDHGGCRQHYVAGLKEKAKSTGGGF